MCGIAGLLSLDGATPPDPGELAAMSAALAHRGPDGAGELRDGPLALAIRRLAIVDPAGGDQPLSCEDGGVQVVCNGEIYNARCAAARSGAPRAPLPDAQRRGGDRPPLRGARHGVPACAAGDVRARALGRSRAAAAPGPRPVRDQAARLRARARAPGLRLRAQGADDAALALARGRPRGARVLPRRELRPCPAHDLPRCAQAAGRPSAGGRRGHGEHRALGAPQARRGRRAAARVRRRAGGGGARAAARLRVRAPRGRRGGRRAALGRGRLGHGGGARRNASWPGR